MSNDPGVAAWERQMWAQLLIWDRPPRIDFIVNDPPGEIRRAEWMITQREPDGSITELADWSLAGIAPQETAGDFARQILARHLGEEAVRELTEGDISVRLETQGGQVVRIIETPDGESVTLPVYGVGFSDPSDDPAVSLLAAQREAPYREELERFRRIIQREDPALSAWNPITGLDPVLCRVCGQSSNEPRVGKVLIHLPYAPCAADDPVPLDPDFPGGPVRDIVLLKSANLREESLPGRNTLQPWEVIDLAVQAYRDAALRTENVAVGPVRECPECQGISHAPTWPASHDSARCSADDGRVVRDLDPTQLTVAAAYLPGNRAITDPDWWHLHAGWWVAPEGTEGPTWAEAYSESETLARVAELATKPQDLDLVILTEQDRKRGREVAGQLGVLRGIFTALDRPETRHGITTLVAAIGDAVSRSWEAVKALHDEDGGTLLHAALGAGPTCPVCEQRYPGRTSATERRMERLAEMVHVRMAHQPGRSLTVRETWIILDKLLGRRDWEEPTPRDFMLANSVAAEINGGIARGEIQGQHRYINVSDVAQVIRAYRAHLTAGGERGPVL